MNIYQTRHAILAKHVGERFTPAQLKVELLEKFPSVKPQSVNAPDCYYSDRKRAGSTCPECRKLRGFAVNKDGVVDMGASGWENISSFYKPTGNTRSSVRPSAGIAAANRKISMSDPLDHFDWKTLYARYDAACTRFDPRSTHLSGVVPPPSTDRTLYYWLVQTAGLNSGKRPVLDLRWYEALLYWKLYSSTPDYSHARMANGDVFMLLIRCPEPECAQRPPQSCPFSRAQLIRSLNSGAAIGVMARSATIRGF